MRPVLIRSGHDPGLTAVTATTGTPSGAAAAATAPPLDLSDFKRDLSELTDRLGQAQDCL
jgi:peptide chain release factor 2